MPRFVCIRSSAPRLRSFSLIRMMFTLRVLSSMWISLSHRYSTSSKRVTISFGCVKK